MQTSRAIVATWFGAACCLLLSGCPRHMPMDAVPDMNRALEIRQGFASGGGKSSASTGPATDPTGWATLKGRFHFPQAGVGGLPSPARLAVMGDDAAVCAPAGKAVYAQDLIVDAASGGLKDVVIFLDSEIPTNDKWIHSSVMPGKAEPVVFDQKECVFLSHVLAMQISQPLEIRNSDPIGHNTNLSPQRSAPFNQIVVSGGQAIYKHQAEERQPYPVKCSIHPWMSAWILPRENGYFAVSKADGSFEIANVPAGVPLDFRVWQERGKFIQSVKVGGKDEKWSKGKLTRTLSPDQELVLDVELDPAAFN